MLRQPECERVHAHAPGTLPLSSAGIVSGALQVKNALPQVTYGIASIQQQRFAGGIAQHRIKISDYLCVRPRAVVERPTGQRRLRPHLEPPLAQQVVRREVMFHHLVAPILRLDYLGANPLLRLRVRRVVCKLARPVLLLAEARAW